MSNEIYKKTIEKWGKTAQLEMAQEEATELALAVRKFIRKPNDKTFDDLSNEMADIEIMIEQIKFMYPEISEKIQIHKEFKLERLSKRVDESSFE
jgi:NTP pyrophosphatase (non-canonical NTP hydrolase)